MPFVIDEMVQIMPTPGHMCHDVSLIVKHGDKVTAITGELANELERCTLWLPLYHTLLLYMIYAIMCYITIVVHDVYYTWSSIVLTFYFYIFEYLKSWEK